MNRNSSCQVIGEHGFDVYSKYECFLESHFQQTHEPAAGQVGADSLAQAFCAIISFMLAGITYATKDLLVSFFSDTVWIQDALDRMRPLLAAGGSLGEDQLDVLYLTLLSFLADSRAPQRFQVNMNSAHLTLMRRCFGLLREELRSPHEWYEVSQGLMYAIEHWPAHWMAVMRSGSDAGHMAECIDALHDFIKGEHWYGEEMLRDDPRVEPELQRGGFASWAEAYYKHQRSKDAKNQTRTWITVWQVLQALDNAFISSERIAAQVNFCKRVLEEFVILVRPLETDAWPWKDNNGEACSGDCSDSLWFSLLAIAPRSSTLFRHFGLQRASPRMLIPDANWMHPLRTRLRLSVPRDEGIAHEALKASKSLLGMQAVDEMDLTVMEPPSALRLRSSLANSEARDLLLNTVGEDLLVLRLQEGAYLFMGKGKHSCRKAWILNLDEDSDEPTIPTPRPAVKVDKGKGKERQTDDWPASSRQAMILRSTMNHPLRALKPM